MSNSKAFSEAVLENGQPAAVENTVLKDFLALIKVGIVNSNAMTTFTGLWLALHFSGAHFLDNIDLILVTLIGSSLIVAGSCSLNNYID
ncbi:MAG: protoheme IX farnesyltransferase, partial [Mesobacillus sp.]